MLFRSRGILLFKLAELIEKNKEELAALEVLDNGRYSRLAKYLKSRLRD